MQANSNKKNTEIFLFQYDTKSYFTMESYIKNPRYTLTKRVQRGK